MPERSGSAAASPLCAAAAVCRGCLWRRLSASAAANNRAGIPPRTPRKGRYKAWHFPAVTGVSRGLIPAGSNISEAVSSPRSDRLAIPEHEQEVSIVQQLIDIKLGVSSSNDHEMRLD